MSRSKKIWLAAILALSGCGNPGPGGLSENAASEPSEANVGYYTQSPPRGYDPDLSYSVCQSIKLRIGPPNSPTKEGFYNITLPQSDHAEGEEKERAIEQKIFNDSGWQVQAVHLWDKEEPSPRVFVIHPGENSEEVEIYPWPVSLEDILLLGSGYRAQILAKEGTGMDVELLCPKFNNYVP